MDKKETIIDIPVKNDSVSVFILKGKLNKFSTENLHFHSCHQILRISSGITLLVEEGKKQPLFSNMTAFIPAGLPHRSIVMGNEVEYKSIYLDENLFDPGLKEIRIFDLSELGAALFDRIDSISGEDYSSIDFQCFNLLLRLLDKEIEKLSHFARIPVPEKSDNLKITSYIEENYHKKINLDDFTKVLFYSKRHITRIFKQDMGISIFDYLKLYRIFQASLQICDENSGTITEIAFACGYNSLSSFYCDFKDIFSITPKDFKLEK